MVRCLLVGGKDVANDAFFQALPSKTKTDDIRHTLKAALEVAVECNNTPLTAVVTHQMIERTTVQERVKPLREHWYYRSFVQGILLADAREYHEVSTTIEDHLKVLSGFSGTGSMIL